MENFNDIDLRRKEIIDGVTVVHTGMSRFVHQGYRSKFSWEGGGHEDLGYSEVEVLEMYDKDGNRFYSNAETLEKAQEYIAKLAEEGITAVIGPKAPWRGQDGKLIPNKSETQVGVFIVNQLEKEQGYTDETPKKHR